MTNESTAGGAPFLEVRGVLPHGLLWVVGNPSAVASLEIEGMGVPNSEGVLVGVSADQPTVVACWDAPASQDLLPREHLCRFTVATPERVLWLVRVPALPLTAIDVASRCTQVEVFVDHVAEAYQVALVLSTDEVC